MASDAIESGMWEDVAYWFFRLNGFLTTRNYIFHRDAGGNQRTEADVVGIRFPFRAELGESAHPLKDHCLFEGDKARRVIEVILADSKRGKCSINTSWGKEDSIKEALRCLGIIPDEDIDDHAGLLARNFQSDYGPYRVRVLTLGLEKSDLPSGITQITWDEVLEFIYTRFKNHMAQKKQHDNWDDAGKDLIDNVKNSPDIGKFIADIKALIISGKWRTDAQRRR